MANAFENSIVKVVRRVLRKDYPHCIKPMVVRARITKVMPTGYSIVILDEENNRDMNYPEIPGVKGGSYKKGNTVIVTFLYGREPYILGGY